MDRVIDVAVDVADLPETRGEIAPVVEGSLQRRLAALDELPGGVVVAEDRRLLIELRPGPIPGADDVLIRVEAQVDGEVIGESATETCLSCTNEQVAEKALPMLRPLLEAFPEPEVAEASAPAMPAATDEGETDAQPRRGSQGLLISGASLLGVGVAGLGAGIALIVVDERVGSEPGAAQLDVIKYRDPGIAVAIVGGAAALTGAVLLGVGLGRRGSSGVVAGPTLGPDNWGVVVSGRF